MKTMFERMTPWLVLALVLTTAHVCFAETAAPPATDATTGFIEQVTTHFAAWDLDKNGELSATELDAMASNEKIVGREAAAVAALKRTLNNKKQTPPKLTLENIVKLSKSPPPALEGPNFPKMYAEGLSKVGKANRVLFDTEIPRMAALHQGRLGDCFCLAPLGAMLARNPQQVAEMFHPRDDGKCDVTLGHKTVTVVMPTDAELALSSSARQDGIWVNIYEKAIGMSRIEAKPEKERSGLPLDAVAHGGSAGTILSLITGHEITRFSCKYFKDDALKSEEKAAKLEELRKQLVAAVREKRLITCGTITPTTPGITPNHAYAILNFDEKTDTLELWNPHGTNFTPKGPPGMETGYPRKDGIFSMPLTDFVQQFSGVSFEQFANHK